MRAFLFLPSVLTSNDLLPPFPHHFFFFLWKFPFFFSSHSLVFFIFLYICNLALYILFFPFCSHSFPFFFHCFIFSFSHTIDTLDWSRVTVSSRDFKQSKVPHTRSHVVESWRKAFACFLRVYECVNVYNHCFKRAHSLLERTC